MERDFFMSASESVAYGLADKIIDKRGWPVIYSVL
jgi:ATP-dependent protease ClpP protease subunit